MNEAIKFRALLVFSNGGTMTKINVPVSVFRFGPLAKGHYDIYLVPKLRPIAHDSKIVNIEEIKPVVLTSKLSDKKVLECIMKVPYVSIQEIMHRTGLGERFVESAVSRLRSENKVCSEYRRHKDSDVKVFFAAKECDGDCMVTGNE